MSILMFLIILLWFPNETAPVVVDGATEAVVVHLLVANPVTSKGLLDRVLFLLLLLWLWRCCGLSSPRDVLGVVVAVGAVTTQKAVAHYSKNTWCRGMQTP